MDDFKESLSCYESTVFPQNLLKSKILSMKRGLTHITRG